MDGEWVGYHKNGQKSYQGRMEAGVPVGPWVHWYENGQKKAEGELAANGKRTGPWRLWYEDGRPDEELSGEYVNGVKKP
jgi:antitoxin component YwqK of YwqJK toxin-antitoxin module